MWACFISKIQSTPQVPTNDLKYLQEKINHLKTWKSVPINKKCVSHCLTVTKRSCANNVSFFKTCSRKLRVKTLVKVNLFSTRFCSGWCALLTQYNSRQCITLGAVSGNLFFLRYECVKPCWWGDLHLRLGGKWPIGGMTKRLSSWQKKHEVIREPKCMTKHSWKNNVISIDTW